MSTVFACKMITKGLAQAVKDSNDDITASTAEVTEILETFWKYTLDQVQEGKTVKIVGVMNFSRVLKAAREYSLPRSKDGEKIKKEARYAMNVKLMAGIKKTMEAVSVDADEPVDEVKVVVEESDSETETVPAKGKPVKAVVKAKAPAKEKPAPAKKAVTPRPSDIDSESEAKPTPSMAKGSAKGSKTSPKHSDVDSEEEDKPVTKPVAPKKGKAAPKAKGKAVAETKSDLKSEDISPPHSAAGSKPSSKSKTTKTGAAFIFDDDESD